VRRGGEAGAPPGLSSSQPSCALLLGVKPPPHALLGLAAALPAAAAGLGCATAARGREGRRDLVVGAGWRPQGWGRPGEGGEEEVRMGRTEQKVCGGG
jgi:hypothetical protein